LIVCKIPNWRDASRRYFAPDIVDDLAHVGDLREAPAVTPPA
jgi:hypothetical protein